MQRLRIKLRQPQLKKLNFQISKQIILSQTLLQKFKIKK